MIFEFHPELLVRQKGAANKNAIYFKHRDVLNINLEPHEMIGIRARSELDALLLRKIERLYQGRCTQYGYVVPSHPRLHADSRELCKLRVISRTVGCAVGEHCNGAWVYKICFEYLVCNPSIDTVVNAVVVGVNKFGMMCQLYPYKINKDHFTTEASEKGAAPAMCGLPAKHLPLSRANYVVILLPKQLQPQSGVDQTSVYDHVKNMFEEKNNNANGHNASFLPLVRVRIMRSKFEVTPTGASTIQQSGQQINAIGVLEKTVSVDDTPDGASNDVGEEIDGDKGYGADEGDGADEEEDDEDEEDDEEDDEEHEEDDEDEDEEDDDEDGDDEEEGEEDDVVEEACVDEDEDDEDDDDDEDRNTSVDAAEIDEDGVAHDDPDSLLVDEDDEDSD